MAFGDFYTLCNNTPLPLCQVLTNTKETSFELIDNSILPICYARSIEVANTVIFQIGNAFVNICALVIVLIIIYNVRAKYTAIGRLEMLLFYHIVLALIICTLVVDCGVSPPNSSSYPYLVSLQLGLASASCWCLMTCGFLGFRFWEDGSTKSLILIRASSLIIGALSFVIGILTFHDWIKNGTVDSTNPIGLFVVAYVLNAVFLFTYVVAQITLSLMLIKSLWALGAIALGLVGFIVGQVLTYAFSRQICEGVKHYLDGLFFGSLCNLFAIMMVYKFWDMTTDEDLEFSIRIEKDGEVLYAER